MGARHYVCDKSVVKFYFYFYLKINFHITKNFFRGKGKKYIFLFSEKKPYVLKHWINAAKGHVVSRGSRIINKE